MQSGHELKSYPDVVELAAGSFIRSLLIRILLIYPFELDRKMVLLSKE
ncbi:hypothetical protein ES708_08300 [subsurface metagenome]